MKIYKRVQKIIQDSYMIVFGATLFDMMFLRFIPMRDVNFLSVAFVISTILTVGKGITHYRTNPKQVRKEIYEMFRSENGINF